ncbi:MAG: hypothetical protein WDO18_06280 [Acidobacteriota bacterium]
MFPDAPKWRWYSDKDVVRGYDFEAKGFRTKRVRGEGNVPPGGGAGTTTPAPTQNQDTIAMANNFANQVEMAMTPIGFLKMAQANNATLSRFRRAPKRARSGPSSATRSTRAAIKPRSAASSTTRIWSRWWKS